MYPLIRVLMLHVFIISTAISSAVSAAEPVRIGVLAFRPKPQTLVQWKPLGIALKQAMPSREFVIEALTFPELEAAVVNRQVDFVLTNPGHYVLLTKRIGLLAPLATLATNDNGKSSTEFGGVIFTREGQANIHKLSDIRGKSVAVTSTESFGGYQMQAFELSRIGIRLPQDAKLIATGMPHDNVVQAVLSGRAEVGFVRTGVLEGMAREGKLNLKQLRIINRQNKPNFPALLSTRLYPEWTFAALPHIDENLARHVAAAIFMLEENTSATRAMDIHGFVVPADYTPVADLLKELRLPPFDEAPEFTLNDVWSRYLWQNITALIAIGIILLLGLHLLVTRRKMWANYERFRTLFDRASDGILIVSPKGELVSTNESFAQMHGYTPQEMQALNLRDLDTPVSAGQMPERMQRIMAGEMLTFEAENYRKDGSFFPMEVTASLIMLDGEPMIQSFARDITERKLAEAKLSESELRYRLLIETANEGIVVAQGNTLKFINNRVMELSGYSEAELMALPFIEFIYEDDRELILNNFQKRLRGETVDQRYQVRIMTKDKCIKWVEMSGAQIEWEGHMATFNFVTDITERIVHEHQLEHIAHYDALTNLPNRVLLADRLHQGMTQGQRHGQSLAVAYLDLDGFKAINDSHGHDIGDHLLKIVAANMKQVLREGDTLARIGGDEFVAVLLDVHDIDSSEPMLNRLLASAAQPVEIGAHVLQVSASLGVTFYPQKEGVDADQLLRQADQAMYQAKLAGKNRYYVFDADQDNSIRGHHESLEEIRRALIGREFVLYYQPKVNMRTGMVVGAEALIRWQHPEMGLLPPGVFLPVIEDHPLAVEIGEWVIDTALSQLEIWHQAGLDIPVSVNVGALQLQQAGFVANLRAILAAHPNIKPSYLQIEVLETSALQDISLVSQVMEACREIGVSFALDDFGTGYSSLTYLKRLPVSVLKIDQSFVRDMLDDPDDLAILEGVLGLAIAFRREVIAEGVETLESGAMLLQLGCDHAQGFGIARPMPGQDMPAWAASWRPDATWADSRPVSRDDLPILFASVEHRAWIAAIESYLKNELETAPPIDPHQCRFGQWLDSVGFARYEKQPVFDVIDALHRQVHTLGAKLLELHVYGQNTEARARLGELHELSDKLLQQLKSLTQA
jgi:diguanylate cyclase (GGDEF)-like protein/PAS domain S-box-containing protein